MFLTVVYSFDFPMFAVKPLHYLIARKPIITRAPNTDTINQRVL